MNIEVNDKFIFHTIDGRDPEIKIIDVSNYRPLESKYAVYIYDESRSYDENLIFVGDNFFERNAWRLEKIK